MKDIVIFAAIRAPWIIVTVITLLRLGYLFLSERGPEGRQTRSLLGTTVSLALMVLFIQYWPSEISLALLIAIVAASLQTVSATKQYLGRDNYPMVFVGRVGRKQRGVNFYLLVEVIGYALLIPTLVNWEKLIELAMLLR